MAEGLLIHAVAAESIIDVFLDWNQIHTYMYVFIHMYVSMYVCLCLIMMRFWNLLGSDGIYR